MNCGKIWVMAAIMMLATAGVMAVPLQSTTYGDGSNPITLGTDHAVFGEVKTSTGHPPDGTPVTVTALHAGIYTEYAVTGGLTGGWYSKTLPGTQQRVNWDIGDDIWVNVSYSGNTYYNQTTITSATNQQIDVLMYGTNHAVWGRVADPFDGNVSDGTPVSIVVFHIDHYTAYEVTGGTSGGYYSKTLPAGEYGIHWQTGDTAWVNVTYLGSASANSSAVTDGTNQQVDVQTTFKIPVVAGWNLISCPLVPDDASLPGVLADMDGDTTWDRVLWYDPTDVQDPWKHYRFNGTANDLASFDHTMGLWVHVTVPGNGFITMDCAWFSMPTSTAITLNTGWNLVGYPSAPARLASSTLPAEADIVSVYQTASPYIQDFTDKGLVTMSPSEGYWIHTTADCVWTVDWS